MLLRKYVTIYRERESDPKHKSNLKTFYYLNLKILDIENVHSFHNTQKCFATHLVFSPQPPNLPQTFNKKTVKVHNLSPLIQS